MCYVNEWMNFIKKFAEWEKSKQKIAHNMWFHLDKILEIAN